MYPCTGAGQAGCPIGTRTVCSTAPLKEMENSSLNKHSWRNVIIEHQLWIGMEKERIAFCCCCFCKFCYSIWHCPNTDSFSCGLGVFFRLISLSFHKQNGKKGEVKKGKTKFYWLFSKKTPIFPAKVFVSHKNCWVNLVGISSYNSWIPQEGENETLFLYQKQ